jgi:hypothetical protein
MVAAVQCQDCGGLGSFHDIRKKLARSFFGGLPWHGDYFSMLASLIQIVFPDYAVLLILQILFNLISKLKPQRSQT